MSKSNQGLAKPLYTFLIQSLIRVEPNDWGLKILVTNLETQKTYIYGFWLVLNNREDFIHLQDKYIINYARVIQMHFSNCESIPHVFDQYLTYWKNGFTTYTEINVNYRYHLNINIILYDTD